MSFGWPSTCRIRRNQCPLVGQVREENGEINVLWLAKYLKKTEKSMSFGWPSTCRIRRNQCPLVGQVCEENGEINVLWLAKYLKKTEKSMSFGTYQVSLKLFHWFQGGKSLKGFFTIYMGMLAILVM